MSERPGPLEYHCRFDVMSCHRCGRAYRVSYFVDHDRWDAPGFCPFCGAVRKALAAVVDASGTSDGTCPDADGTCPIEGGDA